MTRVIGIDISTKKLACVLLDGSTWRDVEFSAKAKTWDLRLDDLQEQFWIFLRDSVTDDDFLFIEEVPYVQNVQALIRLVHTVAMCRTLSTFFHRKYRYVNNLTWKKRVVGTGKVSKEDIVLKAQKIYGVEETQHLSQDSFDALLIATYGQNILRYEKWQNYDSVEEHYRGGSHGLV
mgnify:FL=1